MVKQETIDAAAKQVETLLRERSSGEYISSRNVTRQGLNALIEVLAEVRGKAQFVTDRQQQLRELCEVTTMSVQHMQKQLEVVREVLGVLSKEVVR